MKSVEFHVNREHWKSLFVISLTTIMILEIGNWFNCITTSDTKCTRKTRRTMTSTISFRRTHKMETNSNRCRRSHWKLQSQISHCSINYACICDWLLNSLGFSSSFVYCRIRRRSMTFIPLTTQTNTLSSMSFSLLEMGNLKLHSMTTTTLRWSHFSVLIASIERYCFMSCK